MLTLLQPSIEMYYLPLMNMHHLKDREFSMQIHHNEHLLTSIKERDYLKKVAARTKSDHTDCFQEQEKQCEQIKKSTIHKAKKKIN